MTEVDKETMKPTDDPVEQLLAKAEPRPTPPPEVIAQAREAVMAEWQHANRRRQGKWYGLAAAIVIACVAGYSVSIDSGLPDPSTLASIDKVNGDFRFRQDDGLLITRPGDDTVRSGDTIITSANSTLGLDWHGGGSLRLDAETSVRFLQEDQIDLLRGRIYFDSKTEHEAGIALTIHTDYGDVQHRGTQFMTDVRRSDFLIVSVREGSVAISGVYHDAKATLGEQVTLHGNRVPSVASLATHGAEWQWIQSVAPAVDMDGRTFAQILEWVCRETGLTLRFETEAARELANDALAGVEAEDPMAVLRQGAAAAGLHFEEVEGVIVVSRRRP